MSGISHFRPCLRINGRHENQIHVGEQGYVSLNRAQMPLADFWTLLKGTVEIAVGFRKDFSRHDAEPAWHEIVCAH